MVIILKLTSRPPLSLLLCSTYLQYICYICYWVRTHLRIFFMISRTKYTKNVLVGSLAALVRDEIHCNEYPGTRRVMSVGYPGSKFSTRFNPSFEARWSWISVAMLMNLTMPNLWLCFGATLSEQTQPRGMLHMSMEGRLQHGVNCIISLLWLVSIGWGN